MSILLKLMLFRHARSQKELIVFSASPYVYILL